MKKLLILLYIFVNADKCQRYEKYIECKEIENTDRNVIFEKDICDYYVSNSKGLTEQHFDSLEKIETENCDTGLGLIILNHNRCHLADSSLAVRLLMEQRG